MSTVTLNPFTGEFDVLGTAVGPIAVTITGNDDNPQSGTSFTIVGIDGLAVNWDETNSQFEISGTPTSFYCNMQPGLTVNAADQNGYVLTNTSMVTVNLPANADTNFGDSFKVIGLSGGFTLAQAADQQIRILESTSTLGVDGNFVSSGGTYSSITLVCISTAGGVYIWANDGGPAGNFIKT